jgi:hypothetical protein
MVGIERKSLTGRLVKGKKMAEYCLLSLKTTKSTGLRFLNSECPELIT